MNLRLFKARLEDLKTFSQTKGIVTNGGKMRQNMVDDNRQPNYKTPTDSLLWGYDCTDKALDNFLEGKTKDARDNAYDVRESIRDALFLLGFRGNILEAAKKLPAPKKQTREEE